MGPNRIPEDPWRNFVNSEPIPIPSEGCNADRTACLNGETDVNGHSLSFAKSIVVYLVYMKDYAFYSM